MTASTLPGGMTWATMCPHPSWDQLYAGVLGRCRSCGLVATARKPEFSYDAGYFTGQENGGYDFESAFACAFDAARFSEELARLERLGLNGSVLDIGCATGSFLVHAQKRGWSIAGVEPVAAARARAVRRVGNGAAIVESLDALPHGQFDVVTLHHVLEHILDPLTFLRDDLRPRVGRVLLIEVPNFASLPSRADGCRWRDLRPEQHVCHYDEASLGRLVDAAGYRVRRIFTLWVPLWSLRTGLDLLRVLPAVFRDGRKANVSCTDPPVAVGDAMAYRPSAGWRHAADRVSYLLMRPIVRALEMAGLGERLVLEAEPRNDQPPRSPR